MKERWKIVAFALFWAIWSVILTLCITRSHNQMSNDKELSETVKRDTVVVYDTVTIVEPVPVSTVATETVSRKLPVDKTDTIYKYIRESYPIDSISVEIPKTQVHYADSSYQAWVSGFEPKLDSIIVYREKEFITIERVLKEKKKHWHIGPTVGYGYTVKGFQPFIGISISYSILNF